MQIAFLVLFFCLVISLLVSICVKRVQAYHLSSTCIVHRVHMEGINTGY